MSGESLRLPILADHRLTKLLAYWKSRCGDRAIPARKDIDPIDLPFVLGHLLLLQVTEGPRFRFRLHGSELAQRIGHDMTGLYVEDLPNPENRAILLERCRQLLQSGRPYLGRGRRVAGDRRYSYEALWLPLSDDGLSVSMLLGGLIYTDDWSSAEPLV